MTKLLAVALLAFMAIGSPAFAQQNQTPGDTTAGGGAVDGAETSNALTAQSGANTTDGTTTGSSGPKDPGGGPPGDLSLPPLPSTDLCGSYLGHVQAACLATTLYQRLEPLQEPQNDQ